MMRFLLLLMLTQALSLPMQAQVEGSYKIVSVLNDDLIPLDSLKLTVRFTDTKGQMLSGRVDIGIGMKTFRPVIDSLGTVRLMLHRRLAGKSVHFFSAVGYDLRTDLIDWESGNSLSMEVEFEPIPPHRDYMPVAEKPVIYLHPVTTIRVSVRVGFSGEDFFTYPEHGDGWNVTAHPNGEMEADGRRYRYLFWEGKLGDKHVQLDLSTGFVIRRDELVSYFERTLRHIGLSDIEAGDFITYWVSRMVEHERVFLHFLTGKEYDRLATLDVNPMPDRVIRLFMFWKGIGPNEHPQPTGQELPSHKREGFTVVEWGGSELSTMPKVAN